MSRENATEEKTSDFRRRTSARSGARRLRLPYGARVVASRGLELEVTIRGSGTLAASALARHCEATGVSLLYLTIDGVVYIPCYDSNGNVTRYLNANGGTFARYSYDAFGRLIAKSGRRSSLFRHRFSTKYFDSETDLYYYGYRFYHPSLMRWLNRDPIAENGGMNVYGFVSNDGLSMQDHLGLSFGAIGPNTGFVSETVKGDIYSYDSDVWLAIFGESEYDVHRKIVYKPCSCPKGSSDGGKKLKERTCEYFSRRTGSTMYYRNTLSNEDRLFYHSEVVSASMPHGLQGTIDILIEVLPLGTPKLSEERASLSNDDRYWGFGTENRGSYGDGSQFHRFTNYKVPNDSSWKPLNTLASVSFTVVVKCADSDDDNLFVATLKEKIKWTGDWGLNGKGWKRTFGKGPNEYGSVYREEGNALEVGR